MESARGLRQGQAGGAGAGRAGSGRVRSAWDGPSRSNCGLMLVLGAAVGLWLAAPGCSKTSPAGGEEKGVKNGAAARVVVKTVDEFRQQVVESKQPVVVDFFATWCGPCKLLAPILDKLEEEYAGGVKFVAVDVDQANELARRHNIEGVPTLEFYRDGKLAGRVVGLEPESRLRQRVAGLLSGS